MRLRATSCVGQRHIAKGGEEVGRRSSGLRKSRGSDGKQGRAMRVGKVRESTHASPSSTSASSSPPARAKSSSSISDIVKAAREDSAVNSGS
jgi:hypothetical protein